MDQKMDHCNFFFLMKMKPVLENHFLGEIGHSHRSYVDCNAFILIVAFQKWQRLFLTWQIFKYNLLKQAHISNKQIQFESKQSNRSILVSKL